MISVFLPKMMSRQAGEQTDENGKQRGRVSELTCFTQTTADSLRQTCHRVAEVADAIYLRTCKQMLGVVLGLPDRLSRSVATRSRKFRSSPSSRPVS